ncbi:hypothetical protein GCM10023206_07370 [Acinetobacter puyangensis]|uniref:Restriction endonuclease n=1 Tax=Acinetobacter puyangensis TaxID=1096779 RepID=A0A240E7G4_9GAMM|nr:hypothetical protein [Acinetobacter puyangensis]SNX44183.1 hypothetical protein SAMN05421731_102344 [Acinetobacter puyangensis]
MGSIAVDIMPPAYWQDFEKLTLDICKKRWDDDYAQRNGRSGQKQAGVDVYGCNKTSKEFTGIQCKKRTWTLKPGADSPCNTLTNKEIDNEYLAVKEFSPKLDRFIIATTGPRDKDLQEHVRKINDTNPSIKITIWFWEDYVEYLNDYPDLMYRYYENILKYRSSYNSDEHYLRLLSMAFDRPSIRTPFHLENRATDFIDALAATQAAISTGCLKDSGNKTIDQARVPSPLPNELKHAKKCLQKARIIATNAIKEGIIQEHHSVIEIRDPEIAIKLNKLREEAVNFLNTVLKNNNLPTVDNEFWGAL